MTAQMNATPNSAPGQKQHSMQADSLHEHNNLRSRYGAIGIGAVAAAVRYAGTRKNPAYAPVAPRVEQRFLEPLV